MPLKGPEGPPQVLGPGDLNPFWSEKAKEEAVLKAMRPSSLPEPGNDDPGAGSSWSPQREAWAVETMMRGVAEENGRLWQELERLRAMVGSPAVEQASFMEKMAAALRSREGPQRFALDDLTVAQKELAWGDAVLWMRQLWLYTLPQNSRQKKVGFLKEHPRDPQEYKDTQDGIDYPSFFAWPEWEAFKKKYALEEIRMDMGACGHSRRKPSMLGTNLRPLKLLEGRCGSGKQVTEDYETLGLDGRMKASRSWAAWPVDFKLEVVKGILLELEHPVVSRLSKEEWRRHCAMDHMPFSRECPECQRGAGRARAHRRIPSPDTYTLSLDLCGPFRPGRDLDEPKSRYFMVGVFTVPVYRKGKEVVGLAPGMDKVLSKEPGALELEVGEGELLPEVDGEDLPKHEEGDPGDMEKWEELVEPEEVEVRNYTMVEPLASRQGHQLLGAVARMVARLNYLNLPVRRVHSDRAGELASKAMRRWCSHREILRTYTSGGDWKANGRAEGEVGLIRRGINVVLKATGLPEEQWPMIARHVGERRGRLQLEALGYVTPELLSYNREVMVKTKSWDDFQGHWRARRRRGWVRGPDVSMLLTSGGHVVETEEGKFVRVVDVVPSEQPEGKDGGLEGALDVQERKTGEGPLRALGEPRFRLREKTAVKDLVVEELQQRLWRGSELANEEFRKVEVGKEYDGVAMDLIYQVDSENEEIARRLEEVQMRACQVELEGVQEVSEELFLQTRTVGLQEVRKNLEDWVPSMKAEVDNFVSNQAIQRVSKGETELVMEQARLSGKSVEVIPAMGVFTRKSGSGRHRSRIVCCGNRMNDRATEELYASGADATQVRTLLRKAALMNWDVMSLDVKCAFLLAPTSQDELIVVQPPRILEEAGLVNAQERWIVTGAMYGLTTAPRDWAGHRDNTLRTMEWTQVVDGQPMTLGLVAMKDSNLWAIKEMKNVEKKSCTVR